MALWKKAIINPKSSLKDVLENIDNTGIQIALVVDSVGRLIGTASDGDVRRALLKGVDLSTNIAEIMNTNFTFVYNDASETQIFNLMHDTGLKQIPILNENGLVSGLALWSNIHRYKKRENFVVIMAGGLGSRLSELTRSTPKPMLRVGDYPLLETIISGYAKYGFSNFFISVNYLSEQIEDYFSDGSKFGVNITYIREQKRMGTAGSLSLLPERPSLPLIVGNADLLTQMDYGKLIDSHIASGLDVTMASRKYDVQIPFGVIKSDENEVRDIIEKPVYPFSVSAGVNVLSPHIVDLVPPKAYFDMPELIRAAIDNDYKVRMHEITGYWRDVGQLNDFEAANQEFTSFFND